MRYGEQCYRIRNIDILEDVDRGQGRSVVRWIWSRYGSWKDRWSRGAVKGFRGGRHFGDQQ